MCLRGRAVIGMVATCAVVDFGVVSTGCDWWTLRL